MENGLNSTERLSGKGGPDLVPSQRCQASLNLLDWCADLGVPRNNLRAFPQVNWGSWV